MPLNFAEDVFLYQQEMWVCLKTFLLRNPNKIYINQISTAGILRRFILPNKLHLSVEFTLRSDVYKSKMIAFIRIDRAACIPSSKADFTYISDRSSLRKIITWAKFVEAANAGYF